MYVLTQCTIDTSLCVCGHVAILLLTYCGSRYINLQNKLMRFVLARSHEGFREQLFYALQISLCPEE